MEQPITSLFSQNLSPLILHVFSSWKIIIADESSIIITGISDIYLSPFLTLKNALHVPKLATNLISIQHLINDSNCSLTFLLNYCVFRTEIRGEWLGMLRKTMGSTILNWQTKLVSITNNTTLTPIWLQHHSLGHPSFTVLHVMFPSLFKNVDVSIF